MASIKPQQIIVKLRNALGESVVLENPEKIRKGKSWDISKEYLDKLLDIARNIRKGRGAILDLSLSFEDLLDDIIKQLFFGTKITPASRLFEDNILKTNFFTLMEKWKVFRAFTKQHKKLKRKRLSGLLNQMHELINVRNKFAHGRLIFRGRESS